jgi:cullin-associated NEDD8-dissociated protein 1
MWETNLQRSNWQGLPSSHKQNTASCIRASAQGDNEITEAWLFTIESVVKRSPKEVEPYLEGILKLASRAVVYDPNYETLK